MPPDADLIAVAERLRQARQVCVLTGAGVSAESGVPTFRGAQTGLWARYDPMQLATRQAYDANPDLVWRWYAWRRQLVANVEPNPGHYALAELQNLLPELGLITQNVDGLHHRAGSRNAIELHGSLFDNVCSAGDCDVSALDVDAIPDQCPLCPHCGAGIRPGVVWFGEQLPVTPIQQADKATSVCDLFLSIGTSAQVWPAAGLADVARKNGAALVEINLDPTSLTDHVDFCLPGKSGEILPAVVAILKKRC